MVGGAWFSLEEVVKPYSNGTPFTPEPEPFNFALLPRTAYQDIFHLPRVAPAELERGNGSVTVERWSPQRRAGRVELNGNDRLLLRAFAFPGWQVSVDGESAAIESSRALRVRKASGDEAVIRELESPGWSPVVEGEPVEIIEEVSLGAGRDARRGGHRGAVRELGDEHACLRTFDVCLGAREARLLDRSRGSGSRVRGASRRPWWGHRVTPSSGIGRARPAEGAPRVR